jgi:alkylhydroperoxidase family enzyme
MSLIRLIEQPESEELRDLFGRLEPASAGLGLLNVFKVMAHNPRLLRDWLRLANGLLTGTLQLAPRLRELAILRVFQLTGGEYGFAHHIRIGRQAGLSDDEMAALDGYDDDDRFSDLDRLVLQYTDTVTRLSGPEPALARRLLQSLSERELLELTFVIAHWNMLARILQPLEVEVDETLTQELPPDWQEWM